jgi:hypothetical protein
MKMDKSSEYERFEELAKRLAKVPKRELDELEREQAPSKTDPSDDETPDEDQA